MITPQRLIAPVQLPSAVGVLYVCPANRYTILKKVILSNNDTGPGAQVPTFYLVPQGSSPGVTNIILPNAIAPLKDSEVYELENITMMPGDSLQGFSTSAGVLTLHLTGNLVDV